MEKINQAGCRPREKERGIEMRKVIGGKVYDTDTAKQIAAASYSHYGDSQYWCEGLYRTKKGNWFLCGEGSAMSKFARAVGQNEVGGGSAIIPLTRGKALSWLEAHAPASEAFEEYFSDAIEDA